MYKPILGLEVHVELNTKSKMFCSCRNNPKAGIPNSEICPICMGHPGTLPVINKEAVMKVLKTGLALDCQVQEFSEFARKNYFYPDLPKGYQISQYDMPLCKEGYLDIPIIEEITEAEKSKIKNQKSKIQIKNKKIRIRRVHLEEDTGSLIHPEGSDYSLVDFNRAGIPLMELVTEPDLNSAKESRKFAEEFQLILRHLDVSDADMEKGQMRCEVNISLSDSNKLGTKVEVKNLNSFRAVEKAIDYEIKRQEKVLNSGKKVIQETRGWDDVRGITVSQREKEEAQDYRYFPEPDLPPLSISQNLINEINSEIPELPQQKRKRLKEEYNLSGKETEIFIRDKDFSEFFEKVMSGLTQWLKEKKVGIEGREFAKLSRISSNYMLTDLMGLLKGAAVTGEDFLITPENFAEFITLLYGGQISSKIAKIVLAEMFSTGAGPCHIIEEKELVQITNDAQIEKIIKNIIAKNEKAILDYKSGKESALQFLIGQVMTETKGKAAPGIVNKLLKKILSS